MKRNQFFSCKGIQMMLLAVMMLLQTMTCGAQVIKDYKGIKYRISETDGRYPRAEIIGLADNVLAGQESSITIPVKVDDAYVSKIPDSCFQKSNVTSVKIEKKTYDEIIIPEKAFYNCKYLTSVDFDGNDVDIKDKAFMGCEKLNNLQNYENLFHLGVSAFENCKGLLKFTIYNSLNSIQSRAFYNSGLGYLNVIGFSWNLSRSDEYWIGTEVFAYTKFTEVPTEFNYYREGMFKGCKLLTNVTIPTKIRQIPKECFANTNIKSLTIPNHVKRIDQEAFNTVTNLHIDNDSIIKISGIHYLVSRFGNNVTDLTFSEKVKSIGDSWASGAKKLKNVEFRSGMTIGGLAFCYCESLPSTMTLSGLSIHEGAFCWSSVKDLTVNKCTLFKGALSGLELTSLTLNNTSLLPFAMMGCEAENVTYETETNGATSNRFTGMTITGSLYYKGNAIFEGDFQGNKMQYVRLSNVGFVYEGAFRGCGRLSTVKFDEGSTIVLKSESFANCPELTSMTLGENVWVSKDAFKGSFLTSDYNEAYGASDLTITNLSHLQDGALNGAKFRMINVLDKQPVGNGLRNTTTKGINFENATILGENEILAFSNLQTLYVPKVYTLTQKDIGTAYNLKDVGIVNNGHISVSAGDAGCVYSADRKTLLYVCPGRNEVRLSSTVEKIDLRGTNISSYGDVGYSGVPIINATYITDHKVTPINDDGTRACAKYIRIATGCRKYFAEFENISSFYRPTLVQDYIQGDVNDDGKVSVADVMNVYDQLK